MKSVPVVLLALVVRSIAFPSTPILQQNQAGSRDMEGNQHSWASDWHRSVPHSTDGFGAASTDLEGGAASMSSTSASTTSSGVLSKRQAQTSLLTTTGSPILQQNQVGNKDMEGKQHSWVSDWHHSVPHSTDGFGAVSTDLEGDFATAKTTSASSVGSGVLSKRQGRTSLLTATATPILEQNQAGNRDMEGNRHSWASDWHHSVPHSTDAFGAKPTDLEGDVAKNTTSASSVGSGVLSRRQASSTSRSSSTTTTRSSTTTTTTRPTTTTTTTRSTTTTTTTTTRPTTTTTTTRPTTTTTTTTTRSTATTTTSKTTTKSGASTVDAQIQTTTTTSARPGSTSSTKTSTSSTTTTTLRTTTTSRTTTTTTTTTTKKTTTTTTTLAATRTIDVTGMTYQNALLISHNVHRANHSLPDLVWDADLTRIAQDIASNCVYGHNVTADGGGYGQNIGAGAPGNAAAGLVNNLMYNGEINYYPLPYGDDNPDLTNFHLWGHYSQLLWTDTTNVGCYTQYCPNGLANTGPGVAPYFTVCNYGPPGNYVGEFSEVPAPNGGQTVVIVGS